MGKHSWEKRYFTTAEDAYLVLQKTPMEKRDVCVGKFEQRDVEVPIAWSQSAGNVFVSKYFRGRHGTSERETSVTQVVARIVSWIMDHGLTGGYFASGRDGAEAFGAELAYVLVNQYASFNSPVWFNIGVPGVPQQASACFINSVDDSMESILELCRREGLIFKGGSGAGVNMSRLRGSTELLSGGGNASGPVSFMRGLDAFAGVIKSGGRTRRAAKLVCLDDDHPDLLDFIRCKAKAEEAARALVAAGWPADSFTDDWAASALVPYQNANNSVRATDAFMRAATLENRQWWLVDRLGGGRHEVDARALLDEAAKAAWACGDPGLQFHDTVNRWHTCPNSGPIRASNPCGEYVHLDDSSCNLASLNLAKFGSDRHTYLHVVRLMTVAMDIIAGSCDYPTEAIARTSRTHRQLGLGYANLGAELMSYGLAYDSDEARSTAASITSAMTAEAYLVSTELAEALGPFAAYEKNADAMLDVVERHLEAAVAAKSGTPHNVKTWELALKNGRAHGFRNSQVTLLAPTGTIGLTMDCDTLGIEPDVALVSTKRLVGGGEMRRINGSVEKALQQLGYHDPLKMCGYLEEYGHLEGSGIKDEHLAVFDTAIPSGPSRRALSWQAHVKMVAAVQPFLSGAVSKTINMPDSATWQDVREAYVMAWSMGCKSITVYRDGSKALQPVTAGIPSGPPPRATPTEYALPIAAPAPKEEEAIGPTSRRKLPADVSGMRHKFRVGSHKGFLHVGEFGDGKLAEIFLTLDKDGSTLSGWASAFSMAVSLGLQHGVPLEGYVSLLRHLRFEPAGFTGNPDQPSASSVVDYVLGWLERKYLLQREVPDAPVQPTAVESTFKRLMPMVEALAQAKVEQMASGRITGDTCGECGGLMRRSGSCNVCTDCGTTTGCS